MANSATPVAMCVGALNAEPRFRNRRESEKQQVAQWTFDRLHEEAVNLPMGCSAEEAEKFTKSALKRIHAAAKSATPAQFEQAYGFPVLLVLTYLPTLIQWAYRFAQWMGWV